MVFVESSQVEGGRISADVHDIRSLTATGPIAVSAAPSARSGPGRSGRRSAAGTVVTEDR